MRQRGSLPIVDNEGGNFFCIEEKGQRESCDEPDEVRDGSGERVLHRGRDAVRRHATYPPWLLITVESWLG